MQKSITFKTKGMQRDLAVSAFNSEFSYENMNIRIITDKENSLLSLSNEIGPKEDDYIIIRGTTIGKAVIDNTLVLFTTGEDKGGAQVDRIYKIKIDSTSDNEASTIYEGNLNFSVVHPIETLVFYENSNIQKVYWTDGLNPPRVINVVADDTTRQSWTNTSFDFVRKLKLSESITIERNNASNGSFAPGVIQYAFTYYSKYGQESNIFYTSPLYYTSYSNRGANPEDKVNNSFIINIENADTNFDYIRVYSILRTSIDATPEVRRVIDLAIPSDSTKYINYVDIGTSGDSIDPTELLYVGGEDVIFGTMTQKDNTLFLGDIEIERRNLGLIDPSIKDYIKKIGIEFITDKKSITPPSPSGYYPYVNQLSDNSQKIKTFKYLEYYRFGIQAQHRTGKWSDPIWINDAQNDKHIETTFYNNSAIKLVTAKGTISGEGADALINLLVGAGYYKIRPVVVYPTLSDRECICQGILCPTVYNVQDRADNAPFAQASWFARPNAPFDVSLSTVGELTKGWEPFNSATDKYTIYSRRGIMENRSLWPTIDGTQYFMDTVNKGAWAEFRHNYPIPSSSSRNGEIQCIFYENTVVPYIAHSASISSGDWLRETTKYVSSNSEKYFIDQSIITLHSPDIEFDNDIKNIDTSNLKLRIIGVAPLTANSSALDIQTSTPVNNYEGTSELPMGFYKEPIGSNNSFNTNFQDSYFGWRGLISGVFWLDDYTGPTSKESHTVGFVVYPWHRNGSLNNTKYANDGYKSAMLDKKKLSNLRFSYKSAYLDESYIWNAYNSKSDSKTGISGVTIFNSNEVSMVQIPAPKNSSLSNINYYGNIDKLLVRSHLLDDSSDNGAYPIAQSWKDAGITSDTSVIHKIFSSIYAKCPSSLTSYTTGVDPVRIKYKSTSHAVLALNYTTTHQQRILPTIEDGDITTKDGTSKVTSWEINKDSETLDTMHHFFWDTSKEILGVSQDVINSIKDSEGNTIKSCIQGDAKNHIGIQYGWLWLGELYNDKVENRFGGQTEEAFENNIWVPCGEPVSIADEKGEAKCSVDENGNSNTILEINWTEGDTYFQRYDHLKTYPFTTEDQNSVVEIVSFMCETRVNLDGRYDRNRGQTNNLVMSPTNFNLMNDVYSQTNNFFNYRAVNPNKLNLNNFHNTITWTKTKTAGEIIDTWTNITLASTLDLDGDKGKINSLKRFNDNIIAFQDRGISQILYNENMQISSSEGVPIEIANSGKVNGKRYLSDTVGCNNKWSICETPKGIYFVDDITKGIYLFNGQLDNISDRLGFHTWMNTESKHIDIWNPKDFNSFVTYYDKGNDEILFITKDKCLGYSELLNQFTSFYNYENSPYFANVNGYGVWIKDGKLWLHNMGEYNNFFNETRPFYTTIIANPNPLTDKVFNTIEFRADTWETEGNLTNSTFDTLTAWNEYQEGKIDLINTKDKPSSLKKKFRIWRANIPRATGSRDRMRNPWLYLKLSMENPGSTRTILHDITVHYFE